MYRTDSPTWLERDRSEASILRRLIAYEMLICSLLEIVSMNLSGI